MPTESVASNEVCEKIVMPESRVFEQRSPELGRDEVPAGHFAPSPAEAHPDLRELLLEIRFLEIQDHAVVECQAHEIRQVELFAIDHATGVAEIFIGPWRNFGHRRLRRQLRALVSGPCRTDGCRIGHG